ncbi:MAG TPA: TRAP transporter large permease [Candidatus Tectomicrobia bacterium]|nr:TRAP transporter large permease [Candidatus Tectomicrobia bacterium]
MTEGLVGLVAMMLIAFARVPIALAMGLVGLVGYAYMRDWNWTVAFAMAQTKVYETGRNYTLSVVPLFILMGNFVTRAGMSQELFRAAYAFIGHLRGGLAMATIWACAGFGGICGSSIATAATMAKVAYPSMRRFGYADRLAAGVIASGGTLGIMIPPSTILVIYGVFTETNIGKLFAAGVLPGLLGAVLLCAAVLYVTARDPRAGPPGERTPWPERWRALGDVWGVAALFLFVMGGIYGGLFTATEGAGMGAFGALAFALGRRALSWRALYDALVESARTTAMLFMILIGALMFAEFVNITTMPADLVAFVTRFEVHPILVVAAICAIYVVLGTAMEELSMVLLTIPVFFPLIVQLGFDPLWFGILIVTVVEIGLISPPVGMNLFVLKTLLPQVGTETVFRGVVPFMVADVIRLALLIAFPVLSLWLPSLMR